MTFSCKPQCLQDQNQDQDQDQDQDNGDDDGNDDDDEHKSVGGWYYFDCAIKVPSKLYHFENSN